MLLNNTIKVAVADAGSLVTNCSLTGVVPRRGCAPGFLLEWTIFLMEAMLGGPVALEVLSAGGYSLVPNSNNTVVGLLWSGKADISLPILSMSEKRMKHIGYLPPLDPSVSNVVYKRTYGTRKPDMDLFKLYPNYIIAWGLFLILLRFIIRLATKSTGASEQRREQMDDRILLTVSFFFGILVSQIRSHVTITFNTPVEVHDPIRSPEEMLRKLESGEYTAVVSSNIYLEVLLKPDALTHADGHWEKLDRFARAAKSNPPIVEPNMERRIEMILSPPTGKKYLTFVGPVLFQFLRGNCNLSFFDARELNFGYDTFGMRPGLKRKLRMRDDIRATAKAERTRIQQKYETVKDTGSCASGDFNSYWKDQPKTLSQLQGAFWTLVIAYGCTLLVVMGELLFHHIWRRIKKPICPKDEDNPEKGDSRLPTPSAPLQTTETPDTQPQVEPKSSESANKE